MIVVVDSNMKRRILIFLTIAFLLLSGCIKLRTNRGPVEIELQGGVAHNYELLLKGEQQVYLLSLDQTGVATLPIKSGTWLVQAFGYDTTGKLLSISDTLKIRANLGGLVALQLQDLNLDESETTRQSAV